MLESRPIMSNFLTLAIASLVNSPAGADGIWGHARIAKARALVGEDLGAELDFAGSQVVVQDLGLGKSFFFFFFEVEEDFNNFCFCWKNCTQFKMGSFDFIYLFFRNSERRRRNQI